MKFLKQVPNLITSLNLAFGFISIVLASNVDTLQYSPYFIFLAAILDFLDGFAARTLKAYSEFGKQLDSLADAVSFGVAPGFIGFQIMLMALQKDLATVGLVDVLFLTSAILIPVFSALRLAKFNIDERQTSEFIGLPTPASALFISSIALILFINETGIVRNFILTPSLLAVIFVADSFLMVSNLRLFSLKFKSPSFSENFIQYLFLGISGVMLFILGLYALPLIIILYVLLSLVEYIQSKPLANKK
jgi:CDP-diacylglycerol---serine O-phosphatidyltransferase